MAQNKNRLIETINRLCKNCCHYILVRGSQMSAPMILKLADLSHLVRIWPVFGPRDNPAVISSSLHLVTRSSHAPRPPLSESCLTPLSPSPPVRRAPGRASPGARDARFGSKVGHIGPNWYKSGAFSDQISVHLARGAKCTEIWSEKAPDLSHLESTIPEPLSSCQASRLPRCPIYCNGF